MARKQVQTAAPALAPKHQGQAPYEPNATHRTAIAALIAIGTPLRAIAQILSISVPTMQKYYDHELKTGREIINARIGAGVVAKALAGDKGASFFYLKCHAGWREQSRVGFIDEEGNPAPVPAAGPAQVVIYLPSNGRDG